MNQHANDFTKTVRTYYDDLKRTKTLSRAREKRLLKLSKKGDVKARNEILESNLKFVFDVAKKYSGRGVSMGDLISEGNMGLIKAIEKFDINNDVKFISYAVWWIKHYMLDAIQKKKSLEFVEIEPGENNDAVIDGKMPDDMDNTDSNNIPSVLYDEQESTEKNALQNSLYNKMFQNLSKREMSVIVNYFGLEGCKKKNMIEIGVEMGITSERVRQIKMTAIRKMRSNAMLCDNIEDFMC